MTASVRVHNLATNEHVIYVGITPREAVRAAYAQERNDWNTWDYAKYDRLVVEGQHAVACGDWAALK